MDMPAISQGFDDPAFGYLPASAFLDHPPQFTAQRLQTDDTLINFREARLGDCIGGGTGLIRVVLKRQKRANGFYLEAEFASMRMKVSRAVASSP